LTESVSRADERLIDKGVAAVYLSRLICAIEQIECFIGVIIAAGILVGTLDGYEE
jgi:hypothetical protein